MKKNSRLRSRRDAYIRYFDRVENSRVRSGWKKAVFILLPVFCILSFLYWYVMIAGAPQLDRPEAIALHAPYDGKIPATNAIAQDTPLSYQIQTYNSKVMRGERTYGICCNKRDRSRHSFELPNSNLQQQGNEGGTYLWYIFTSKLCPKYSAALPRALPPSWRKWQPYRLV